MRLNSRIFFACSILLLSSCHRRQPIAVLPQPPAPPAPVAALQSATREFASGDYAAAARDFERYLTLVPTGGARDQALFHLGLIAVLPDASASDWPRASGFFAQLLMEFPESSLKPVAQLILSLKDETARLTGEVGQLTDQAGQLRAEAARLGAQSSDLTDQIAKLKEEAEALTLDVKDREQRIRQLNTELERLIRIDSERRPRP